jgi:predicted RNA methylase
MQATHDDMLQALRRVTAAQAAYIQLVVDSTDADAGAGTVAVAVATARPSAKAPPRAMTVRRSVGL